MTWAIQIENSGIQASRYDAETKVSKLIRFRDGQTTLSRRFGVSRTPETHPIVLSETGDDMGNDIVELNVADDGMTLEVIGADGITKADILHVIFETVLATDAGAAEVDKSVVFIGEENSVVRDAAVGAGFHEVDFLSSSDAAVREWQHSRDVVEATGVLVVICNADGSVWEKRVKNDHGFMVPDDGPSNRGRFVPAITLDTTQEKGLTQFFEWAQRRQGSRNVVLTGTRTEVVQAFISALESYGYDVFCADHPVIGGSQPQLASRYERCDDAIQAAVASLNFDGIYAAIDCFKYAEAIFDPPPENVQRLRVYVRDAVLSAAAAASEEAFDEAYKLYQEALSLSRTDAEKAGIHVHLVDLYGKSGKIVEAEEAAIAASFLDANVKNESMAKLVFYSEDRRLSDGRGTGTSSNRAYRG